MIHCLQEESEIRKINLDKTENCDGNNITAKKCGRKRKRQAELAKNVRIDLNNNKIVYCIQYKNENDKKILTSKNNNDLDKNQNNNAFSVFHQKKVTIIQKSVSFSLENYNQMMIVYNDITIRFSIIYTPIISNFKFPKINIKFFSNFCQTENLKKYFSRENEKYITSGQYLVTNKPFPEIYLKEHLISCFSPLKIESCSEDMFNIMSNFKFDDKFAFLSNKLKENESLILVDSRKFQFCNHLPNSEFSIISIPDDFLSNLDIQSSNNFAILLRNDYEFANKIEDKKRGYSILDMTNELDSKSVEIINLENENKSNLIEIRYLKQRFNELNKSQQLMKIFGILTEKKSNKIGRWNSILEYSNKSLRKDISKIGCKADNYTIESFENHIHPNKNINSNTDGISLSLSNIEENFYCIICTVNSRDSVLMKCGHVVYCLKCSKIVSDRNRKTQRGSKKNNLGLTEKNLRKGNIMCPLCGVKNLTYMKISY